MSTSVYLVTVDDATGRVVSALKVGAGGELLEGAGATTTAATPSIVLNFFVGGARAPGLGDATARAPGTGDATGSGGSKRP